MHFIENCEYGFTHRRCRCIGPHSITLVECDIVGHADVERSGYDWVGITKINVVDPDGWRKDGTEFGKFITLADFMHRAISSTIRVERKNLLDGHRWF